MERHADCGPGEANAGRPALRRGYFQPMGDSFAFTAQCSLGTCAFPPRHLTSRRRDTRGGECDGPTATPHVDGIRKRGWASSSRGHSQGYSRGCPRALSRETQQNKQARATTKPRGFDRLLLSSLSFVLFAPVTLPACLCLFPESYCSLPYASSHLSLSLSTEPTPVARSSSAVEDRQSTSSYSRRHRKNCREFKFHHQAIRNEA